MADKPSVLIESWLPFEAIGAESRRERGASSALPPLYFLHVWWARRPLTVSRAAILASVLPEWSASWPSPIHDRFPTPQSYHAWFQRLLGITGDPVAGRKMIQWANERGLRLKEHPYGGAPRAFTVNPAEEDLEAMFDLLRDTWGTEQVAVMDPMAGGGSIPFEALRYGFATYANELNPVASLILKATLDYPTRFGPALAEDIRKWGAAWAETVQKQLAQFFPRQPGENIHAYLWARTVACPQTGKPVPLSPNWWLSRGSDPVAMRLLTDPAWDEPRFEIVRGHMRGYDPSEGTIRRGVGRSPWTGEAIDGDYIKGEAQAGRMGQIPFAVTVKRHGGFDFRPPSTDDARAVHRAETALADGKPRWQELDFIPDEPRAEGRADWAAEIYGLDTWAATFSDRQLLSFCTALETLCSIKQSLRAEESPDRAEAIASYLCLALDKAVDYNSTQAVWDVTRQKVAHAFVRHDFSFKWSFAEFDAAHNLLPWALGQVADAYAGIARLAGPAERSLWHQSSQAPRERLHIERRSASDLASVPAGSLHSIVVDPPYYDNVQYAELSNYFYVWLKRSAGDLYPEWFQTELVERDEEAVASPARFAAFGAKRRALAEQDYQRKMAACFREMHRVLRDDGVLTVMFTHKQVEAWDTLATALIGAGFSIKSSWPVHTESEHSLHQARKNAAASTILLTCRKRDTAEDGDTVWWDDIKGRVRSTAREKAEAFAAQGITGVDLYISTFGPVLSVISEHWPVLTSQVDAKTGQPLPLKPEMALDLAREEVIALRKKGLLLGRDVQFDPITDWYLMAWDSFKAQEFPADEARKLALALGLDVEEDLVRRKRVIRKKGSTVVLQLPKRRQCRGQADPEALTFDTLLDAAHSAMLVYEEDGARDCEGFLKRTGLRSDAAFKACLQALINAIPRTKSKGEFVRPEAEALEGIRLAFFDELVAPAEEEPPRVETQMGMWDEEGDEEATGEDDADEDEG